MRARAGSALTFCRWLGRSIFGLAALSDAEDREDARGPLWIVLLGVEAIWMDVRRDARLALSTFVLP